MTSEVLNAYLLQVTSSSPRSSRSSCPPDAHTSSKPGAAAQAVKVLPRHAGNHTVMLIVQAVCVE
jgi:hypothetical protein